MTKLAQRLAIVAVATLGLFGGTASAQKTVVVDVNVVVQAMPEYVTAMKQLEGQKKIWTDTLQTMQTAYKAKLEAYSKVGESASPEFKKKSQEDMAAMEQQFIAYRDSKFNQQDGELIQEQAKLLKPIQEKLTAALQAYAKKEKYAMILPKSATIYTEDALDQTTKFQDYLKAQK